MDTNRNDGQNYQINIFNKGMNTDTALDAVGEGQYIFGQNIRIANNTLLLGNINPNSKEGIVAPVATGVQNSLGYVNALLLQPGQTIDRILATASIGNTGVIIFAKKLPQAIPVGQEPIDTNKAQWLVYRIDKEPTGFVSNLLYASHSLTTKDKFSIVLNKEQEDIIKLYIADGEHGIMQLFVKNGNTQIEDLNKADSEDDLVSGKYFPSDKAIITGTTSGRLKTQQVQYTYRFYKRYGIFSKLAPVTNKIQVINNSRDTEQGNAENTVTTIGLNLEITLDDQIKKLFDHVQLIRISYVVAGQVPEIDIVKDVKIGTGTYMEISDIGEDSLQELSLDEFASLNAQTLVPQVIEQNQGIMFAANVEDDTTFYVDNTNNAVQLTIRGVFQNIVVDSTDSITNDNNRLQLFDFERQSGTNHAPDLNAINIYELNRLYDVTTETGQEGTTGGAGSLEYYEDVDPSTISEIIKNAIQHAIDQLNENSHKLLEVVDPDAATADEHSDYTVSQYLNQCGVTKTDVGGYNDMFTSSLCKSLRRGETYAYGVVLYKKDGTRSDVLCTQQITVPKETEISSWMHTGISLHAKPIGICAQVKIDKTQLPDVVAYEIVRCEKTPATSKVLLTSVLSRPVSEQLYEDNGSRWTPAYPQYFLNISNTEYGHRDNSSSSTDPEDIDVYSLKIIHFNHLDNATIERYYTLFNLDPLETNHIQVLYDTIIQHRDDYFYLYRDYIAQIIDDINAAIRAGQQNATNKVLRNAVTSHTNNLVQMFAPEILYRRNDLLTQLSNETITIQQAYNVMINDVPVELQSASENPLMLYVPYIAVSEYKDKPTTHIMFDYINRRDLSGKQDLLVKRIKDVKQPLWNSGFSQIDTNSSDFRIIGGVKQYKTFNTSIGEYEYVNWVANALYDLPISAEEAKSDTRFALANIKSDDVKAGFRVYNDVEHYDYKMVFDANTSTAHYPKSTFVRHPIGPGPVCFLAEISNNGETLSATGGVYAETSNYIPASVVVNLINQSFNGYTDDQLKYSTYHGFGNFGKLTDDNNGYKVGSLIVFDGDAYITMNEFVTMFKTYDFQSLNDTIISNQYICRVPLESSINTYFDYGMNYRNTQNKNLQLEPGTITNVTTQDRPLHQYNPIYSDNNTSISVFAAQMEEQHNNKFQQRICYSLHKDNGEQIDSWNIFKPADYIDADTRYGEVTNLLSANDTIFFWQDRAFGKLSVNERSLITDNNSNTIQLGQGGVLQRTDYLSTRYGMRPEDYSAINTENGLFWIDILNKAIVANTQNGVVNYGEMLNVQNLINNNITTGKPEIDYDLQNSELLCKCFSANQLVFNIKYNIATAIYTRVYDKILYFNNIVYALKGYNEIRQLNYLSTSDETLLLSPTIIQFVVNNTPSQTKVFDNQKIVVANKSWGDDGTNLYPQTLTFETELDQTSTKNLQGIYTNREGNICYAVPRDSDGISRMRGKWMTVKITDNTPKQDFAISHIITKFRQSYS